VSKSGSIKAIFSPVPVSPSRILPHPAHVARVMMTVVVEEIAATVVGIEAEIAVETVAAATVVETVVAAATAETVAAAVAATAARTVDAPNPLAPLPRVVATRLPP
jgi:hypothetical protein